jgi:hypothetical protein
MPEKSRSETKKYRFDIKLLLLRFKVEAKSKIDVDNVNDSLKI